MLERSESDSQSPFNLEEERNLAARFNQRVEVIDQVIAWYPPENVQMPAAELTTPEERARRTQVLAKVQFNRGFSTGTFVGSRGLIS